MPKNSSDLQARFNTHFKALLEKHAIKAKVFAVGVSGGADSLALAVLLKNFSKIKVTALTVDHGLRKESAEEAQYAGEVLASLGIEHHILRWAGKKPTTGIEEAARNARYALMEEWCEKNKVKHLLTAHHRLDQAETFLMRLQRGSGVYGLSGMLEVAKREKVEIVRPLLGFYPEELKDFLKSKKIDWVNDPHNFCDDFLRVKIRKLLPLLEEKIGLGTERLSDTAERMGRVRDYIETEVENFFKKEVEWFSAFGAKIDLKNFLKLHEELGLRVLAEVLQKIGLREYSPRMENLENLYQALQKTAFKGKTLSGCEVSVTEGLLWVVRENKAKAVLSKKRWESFLAQNPQYKKIKMPHKLRLHLAGQMPTL